VAFSGEPSNVILEGFTQFLPATLQTLGVSRPHICAAPTASLAARLSPSRRAAVSAPLSRRSPPSPVHRRRAADGSLSSAVVEPRTRAAPEPRTWVVPRVAAGRAALCIWAERGFGPEALKLNFIIF
jgi:hypothetical protein